MFVPYWLLIILSGFGCWGILVFIKAIRNGRYGCKCGRVNYGPIICAKCGGRIWQEY